MAKQQIHCPCDEDFAIDIPDTFLFSEDPQLLPSFRKGDFLLVDCPRCGMVIETEFPFTIRGISQMSKKNVAYDTIRFLPELERNRFLSGKITVSEDRLVIGRDELMEKMAIIEEEVDDRIVELIKFLLLEKVDRKDSEDSDSENGETIAISFKGKDESGSMEFHVSGLRSEETAMLKAPASLYKKAEEDLEERLKENPFREILEEPYVSVNKINLEV
jgi:hypothetical protein